MKERKRKVRQTVDGVREQERGTKKELEEERAGGR